MTGGTDTRTDELNGWLSKVRYRTWKIFARYSDAHGYYMQGSFVDSETGERQYSRRWPVSPEATKSEVIQTAFALVLLAEEQEIREKFLYCGEAIFGPHYDVDHLWRLARNGGKAGARKERP